MLKSALEGGHPAGPAKPKSARRALEHRDAHKTWRNMKKKHILVVDDEEDILELVRYHLDREGYLVTCAATGEEGLKLARTKIGRAHV